MTDAGVCPHCHGTGRAPTQVDPVAELAAWLRTRGHVVDAFMRTDERGAAAVLRMTPGALRNDRCYYGRIPYVPVGRRILYELSALSSCVMAGALAPGDDRATFTDPRTIRT
jgi:hypothetical protein